MTEERETPERRSQRQGGRSQRDTRQGSQRDTRQGSQRVPGSEMPPVSPYRPGSPRVPVPPQVSRSMGQTSRLQPPSPPVQVPRSHARPVEPPPVGVPPRSPSSFHRSEPIDEVVTPTMRRRREPRSLRFRFLKTWQFWVIVSVITISGAGGLAAALLLKLPALPNCPAIFWPTASGSLRMYCAQLAANKQTVDDLLEAIALVNGLPQDHPLRPEVNSLIEQWSTAILDLAEEAFQSGNLDEAIAIANKIPADTSAHALIEDRIKQWRSIWAEAEAIYKEAEAAIEKQDLRAAFAAAVRLLYVGNTYWETTKYQELNTIIETARVEGSKLARVRSLIRRGRLSNLLAAIKILEEIKPSSPGHAQTQPLMVQIGEKMIDLAEAQLDRQDAEEALSILRQIPERAGLQEEVQDFTYLASAYQASWGGTVADLESAIIEAQRLERDRPLYSRAQRLISQWQLEIQDLTYLDRARQIAQSGTLEDLTAAIAEAQLVPRNNPRGDEAREEIARWTAQIQTIEDNPLLAEADRIASGGDVLSLQTAINQASRIQEGRALYGEARERIRDWTAQVQTMQDQPYLDRARQLAEMGNIDQAIATAQQIASGRALYDDAQSAINRWRNQSQGQSLMQRAYDNASIGTASMLLNAIRTANQVPEGSPARAEADQMINVWSQEILRIAESEAAYDLERAIATAQSIPARTEAYAAAQLQIQEWQQQLTSPN
ncbi:chromosome segregation ATPase [Oscillatoria sp. FACHB-1407]|uniref:chromosome segregation ATPase n=1 Tax=Oscillatoria sp. FACHB-1407 TaxID=2692847 RepID=UPI001683C6A4|nr:chromosome segregation ATPase [Oscillatoria sp. FACHB-1407]MBD2460446.1 chromosome segregation ATPase [Oscillatoria sp. FACHB-1407]